MFFPCFYFLGYGSNRAVWTGRVCDSLLHYRTHRDRAHGENGKMEIRKRKIKNKVEIR